MEYFQTEKVAPNLTKINDLDNVYAYLIEGSKKAVLVDTCNGIGDLKSFVKTLTTLPLTVICTHGHVDHAGGAYGFEEVYLSEKDFELVKRHTATEFRKSCFGYFNKLAAPPDNAFVPQREGGYKDLLDGQLFDLGGVTLEALALPGHTQGMMCILFRELSMLLLGDGCNGRTFLFGSESSSVEEYQESLHRLLQHEDKFETVLFSHGPFKGDKTIVRESIELCEEVMAGKTDNVPFNFMGSAGILAKTCHSDFSRVDGKKANLVYNPVKIFAR